MAGLLPGLPYEIAVWEILVRLPPKALLRCRAVSPAWRDTTSTTGFLLSHHARQPALPILDRNYGVGDGGWSDIVSLDHRAGRLESVARLKPVPTGLDGSCDGLLRFRPLGRFYVDGSCDGLLLLFRTQSSDHSICNPATRQYAPLHQLKGFFPLGMYPHPPTGEYRMLLYRQEGAFVFTLGSAQPPRHIPCPRPLLPDDNAGLLFQGSMYWYTDIGILVFDTTNESFRRIAPPVGAPLARDDARVFMMGDMLAVFGPNQEGTAIDIWVMPDHQAEVWDFKCRVKLPVAETRQQCQCSDHERLVMVVPGDDAGLLILITCGEWLFQVDIGGKLIASFHPKDKICTHHVLKQSLVQHTFFPTLEGYVVNAPPFI